MVFAGDDYIFNICDKCYSGYIFHALLYWGENCIIIAKSNAFGTHIIKEPVICEAGPVNDTPGLVADLLSSQAVAVKGVIRYPCHGH